MNQQQGQVKQACNLLRVLPRCYRCGKKERKLGGLWRADRHWRVTPQERVHDMKIMNSCEGEQGGLIHSVCQPLKGSEVASHWQVCQRLTKSSPGSGGLGRLRDPGPHDCNLRTDCSRHQKEKDPFKSRGILMWFQNEFARISVEGRKGDIDG